MPENESPVEHEKETRSYVMPLSKPHELPREPKTLSAQYHRIAARRGANRAAVAVGHTILTMTYYLLTREQDYVELGADYYDQHCDQTVDQTAKVTRS